MIRIFLLSLSAFLSVISCGQAKELNFNSKSSFTQWMDTGRDPQKITNLSIQDGWSSRNIEYIPGEEFRNEDFAQISQEFTNLTALRFSMNSALSDSSLQYVRNFPQLRKVSIREARFSDQGLLLLAQNAPQLESLSLTGSLPNMRGNTFIQVLKTLPKLSSLTIDRGSPHAQNFIAWRFVAFALPNTSLRKLSFVYNYDVGRGQTAEEVWSDAFSKMQNFEHLELTLMQETPSRTLLNALKIAKPDLARLSLTATSLNLGEENPFPLQLKMLTIGGYLPWGDHAKNLTSLILLASDLSSLETLEISPSTYRKEPMNILEKSILEKFTSLKILRLFQADSYKHLLEMGQRIKQQRPNLQVFVDGKEL